MIDICNISLLLIFVYGILFCVFVYLFVVCNVVVCSVNINNKKKFNLLNYSFILFTEHNESEHESTIGLSLVLGFIFMMIVDQISSRRNNDSFSSDRNSTATIGLVVHAAADGIALGAAATTSHQDVEMIVFLAIMLHKAPAAFGLVSFLLHEGIDR